MGSRRPGGFVPATMPWHQLEIMTILAENDHEPDVALAEELRRGEHALRDAHLVELSIEVVLVYSWGGTCPDRAANVSVGDMKSWIEEHCAEPLRIDDIVKMSGYSRTRLFALFASAVGMSPNDWLVRCRIEKAKRMLAIGKVSITDIASFCGFSSPAYFATTFRKYTGKSPRELMAKASKVIL